MTRQIKIIVDKHSDGYVAYPLGTKGVAVGEGHSYQAALSEVKSAIRNRGIYCGGNNLRLMGKFPVEVPKARSDAAFRAIGFKLVREAEHIAMRRGRPEGGSDCVSMPNHTTIS